jgi:hypothetical protein
MTEQEEATMAAAERLANIEPGQSVQFSEGELKALQTIAKWWIRLEGTNAVGRVVISFLKWVIFAAATLTAVRLGLIEWLLGEIS